MKINDILNEDGVIVPGVNTTVDVKPGQTEKEAAKFFGHGKPKELHAKARKNSDPNTLYNMGLVESEQLNEIWGPVLKAIKKHGKSVFDVAMSDPRVHSAWLALQRNFANSAARIPADAVQQWIDFAVKVGGGAAAGAATAIGFDRKRDQEKLDQMMNEPTLDEDTSRGIDLTQYNYDDVLQRLDQLYNIFVGLANKELSFADHNVVDLSDEAEQLRKVKNEFERQDAQARADATSPVGSNSEINLGSPTSTNEPTFDPSVSNDGSIISRSIVKRDADGNPMVDKDGNQIFDRYGVDYDPDAEQNYQDNFGTLVPDEFGSPLGQDDDATTQHGDTRDRDAYQQDADLKDLQRFTAIGKEYALSRMDKAKEPWFDPETGEYNDRKHDPIRAIQFHSRISEAIGNQALDQKIGEAWSKKYKRSIDCSNPKGFSQKAHCAGKKK